MGHEQQNTAMEEKKERRERNVVLSCCVSTLAANSETAGRPDVVWYKFYSL